MALPVGISTVTLSGTFLQLDGTAAVGSVSFSTKQALADGTGDVILPKGGISAELDEDGAFEVVLPATDESDLNPTSFTYVVVEQLTTPKATRSYEIELPAASPTVDLADLAPVASVDAVSSYVLKAGDTMSGALAVPTVRGGTGSGGNLALQSTSHATKGLVTSDSDVSITAAGKGLRVKEGSNARMGTSTLTAGTVTVANTSVTANTRILITVQSLGTVAAPKAVAVTARSNGTSFTITSADNTDTSVIGWLLLEPAA